MIRVFGTNDVLFILSAVQWTVGLSLIAFLGGAVGGLVVALGRTSGIKALELLTACIILVFQGTPLLMQLFLVYFGAAVLGVDLNPWLAAAVGLTLHASAFLGEIWRGCIEAVPKGQSEAAVALSLNYCQRVRYIVLPQAAKIALAPTVGFAVQLVKGTSLASIIGFVELTRAGQIVNTATFQPLLVFAIVGAGYFVLCWPLSLAATYLEHRSTTNQMRAAG
jgi:polar amino acid transport system permease protein